MKPYIPNTLKEVRLKLNLRQQDVTDKLGLISTDRISRWEHGLSYPHMLNLFKMSALYKVLPHELYPELLSHCEENRVGISAHLIALRDEKVVRRRLRA